MPTKFSDNETSIGTTNLNFWKELLSEDILFSGPMGWSMVTVGRCMPKAAKLGTRKYVPLILTGRYVIFTYTYSELLLYLLNCQFGRFEELSSD